MLRAGLRYLGELLLLNARNAPFVLQQRDKLLDKDGLIRQQPFIENLEKGVFGILYVVSGLFLDSFRCPGRSVELPNP